MTETGQAIVDGDARNNVTTLKMAFNQAITNSPAFESVYNRLKNERIPSNQVLQDLLAQEGIDQADCEEAATIFLENMRYIGLIQEQTGSEYIIPLEQRIEELPSKAEAVREVSTVHSASESTQEQSIEQEGLLTPRTYSVANVPALHIDIQIHIDSSASVDQIDQIFASMAKHLYGREV